MTPYHDFYPGQDVVCIDADFSAQTPHDQGIRKGEVYRLSWVGMYRHYLDGEYLGVRLKGVERGADPAGYDTEDMPFAARRFRPLVKDRQDGKVKEEELA